MLGLLLLPLSVQAMHPDVNIAKENQEKLDLGLWRNAHAGDTAAVAASLRAGANPNAEANFEVIHGILQSNNCLWYSQPILSYVVGSCYTGPASARESMVKVLLAAKADPNQISKRTVLSEAAASGEPKMVELLIAAGAQVNQLDRLGESALEGTLYRINERIEKRLDPIPGQREAVKALINHHTDVNLASRHGLTGLVWAVKTHDVELVKLLLGAQAQPSVVSTRGQGPFSEVILSDDSHIASLLVAANEDRDVPFEGLLEHARGEVKEVFEDEYIPVVQTAKLNPRKGLKQAIQCGYHGLVKTLLGQLALLLPEQEFETFASLATAEVVHVNERKLANDLDFPEEREEEQEKIVSLFNNYRTVLQLVRVNNKAGALIMAIEFGCCALVKTLVNQAAFRRDQIAYFGGLAKSLYSKTGYCVYKEIGAALAKKMIVHRAFLGAMANGMRLPNEVTAIIARYNLSN